MIRRHKKQLLGLGTMIAVAVLCMGSLTACDPAWKYISLGDSYTAGPLIPDQSTDPLGCLRSDKNWPALVAPTIKTTEFTDISCSGADTNDMLNSQGVDPGPNPPQLSVVDHSAKVVTLQIGGNDIGFSDIVKTCALQLPWDNGCTDDYVKNGVDSLSVKINATAPKVANVLAEIHSRAPKAKVFVVGYPSVLPNSGNGCYPLVPVLPVDVPYLRNKVKELNTMLQTTAAANDAVYVDIYTPSIGHDFCSSSKWVEGIVPTALAAPVHPNATGMRNFATTVSAAINAVVTS